MYHFLTIDIMIWSGQLKMSFYIILSQVIELIFVYALLEVTLVFLLQLIIILALLHFGL